MLGSVRSKNMVIFFPSQDGEKSPQTYLMLQCIMHWNTAQHSTVVQFNMVQKQTILYTVYTVIQHKTTQYTKQYNVTQYSTKQCIIM